ncbi:hypothetical protein CKO09_08005 [Chromatium weissei]|nr:hypothetical protein [Chromatium weissei]
MSDCVQVFTDGACKGNPGAGGWGVFWRYNGVEKELCGGEPKTTNNRMELMAVIVALETLDHSVPIELTTDSQYVSRGVNEWMQKWKRNGWRNANREPVKNRDLWQRLDIALIGHRVRWRWVKGHAGHAENERADRLANQGVIGHRKVSNMRQIVLDTETTGLSFAAGDRVIEIGCVELIDRQLTGKVFHCYLQPDCKVNPDALKVHGITDAFLADKPRFAEIAEEFLHYIDDAELIIHNAPFDTGFLNHELRLWRANTPLLHERGSVIDTLDMARKRHPGQQNNLNALCKRYDVDNSRRDLHGALLDAEILAALYLAMTGGQVTLHLGSQSFTPNTSDAPVAVRHFLNKERAPLPVIYANAASCAAHDARLAAIAAASDDGCLWLKE